MPFRRFLRIHTPPRFILLGLLFLQNLRHNLGGQLQREFYITTKLVGLASLGIRNPQKIDASHQTFGSTNEITNAFFILRILFNEELDGLVRKHKITLLEGQTFLKLLPDVVLQNDLLIGRFLPRAGDDLKTIAKNGVNLGLVVEREDKQALREIKVNPRKLAIMEL